jgi:hypothetical protein
MSREERPLRPAGTTVRRHRPPRRRRRRIDPAAIALLLILALVAAGWWYWNRGDGGDEPAGFAEPETEAPEATKPAGDRAIVVVFPEWDASGYVTEQRQIASRDRPGEDLLGIMSALCAGPAISGAVSALPAGTRALAAFLDPRDQSVVLDFSQELVTGHPGGSAAESATLTSILRTVALNFPGTRHCTILVEGAQVETLAGHIDMVAPFDPRRWL